MYFSTLHISNLTAVLVEYKLNKMLQVSLVEKDSLIRLLNIFKEKNKVTLSYAEPS